MGDGFYRSKDPTNSIKVLKEQIVHRQIKHAISQHEHKTQQVHHTHNGTENVQNGTKRPIISIKTKYYVYIVHVKTIYTSSNRTMS